MNTNKKEKKNSKSSKKPLQMECGSTHCQQLMHHNTPMYMQPQQVQQQQYGLMPNSLPSGCPQMMYSYAQAQPPQYTSLQQTPPPPPQQYMTMPQAHYPQMHFTTTTNQQFWKQPIDIELGSYPAPYQQQQQSQNNQSSQQSQQPCITYGTHTSYQPQW